jgi:hypothetical protein
MKEGLSAPELILKRQRLGDWSKGLQALRSEIYKSEPTVTDPRCDFVPGPLEACEADIYACGKEIAATEEKLALYGFYVPGINERLRQQALIEAEQSRLTRLMLSLLPPLAEVTPITDGLSVEILPELPAASTAERLRAV